VGAALPAAQESIPYASPARKTIGSSHLRLQEKCDSTMMTSRDLVVALLSIAGTVGAGAAVRQQAAVLPSSVFDWNTVPEKKTAVGSTRQFLRAPTATLDELELHVTTLNPGQTSHAPHQHVNEELIVIREGTVEALVDGEWKRVGPGSVIFQASNKLHGLRNVGAGPATYHVINWSSPGMLKKTQE
jgi:quercetin dioxygenase-like cupin family protein